MSNFLQDFRTRSLGPLAAGFSRTGSQWALNAAGTALTEYTDGNPAFDASNGVLLEALRTDYVPHSDDLSDSSTVRGTEISVDYFASGGPLEGRGYTRITNLGVHNINDVYRQWYTGQLSTPIALSLYLRNPSAATEILEIQAPLGVAYGRWILDLSQIGSSWERVTLDHPAVTQANVWVTTASGYTGWFFKLTSGSGVTLDVAQVQQEFADFPTSPIPTDGTTATRQATRLSSSLSTLGVDEVTQDIAFAVSFIAGRDSDADVGYNARLFTLVADADNYLEAYTGAGVVVLKTRSAGANTFPATLTTYSAGDLVTVTVRKSAAGAYIHARNETTGQATSDEHTVAAGQAAFGAALDTVYVGAGNAGGDVEPAMTFVAAKILTGDDMLSDAELAALTADDLRLNQTNYFNRFNLSEVSL